MSLAILYEHPAWFGPLFSALDRRGLPYQAIHADGLILDPEAPPPANIVFNRIGMSSFLRTPDHPIFFAAAAFAQWEAAGARVINGSAALAVDSSKARQLALLAGLGLAIPHTRIVHRPADVTAAAEAIGFPLVVKANIGGSGAGIVRYDSADELAAALRDGTLPDSIDKVLLVQDLVPSASGSIRIETLGGRYLYAIEVSGGGSFDLCPADACQIGSTVTMKPFNPGPALIDAAERVVRAAGIDVGGVELMVDSRDGSPRFYDINALSNFAANAVDLVGFNPHERLVDWIEKLGARS